ncbi:dolichyl-diphosphooligosaccharide--protein glycosyltransferase subunit DAD1 [Phymastichus coffea]|uniref:dolichyl-diphosphooligosaccharide--protein glycosyltransferase subunit DAD1 n=1 Tax=Phymastichus coffea TaxID=108790 RepID=UPI00273B7957|nr:dolichyl-diphosphooligosaccharide--protein glycosyltransferase subunit DAD1 [Phymastichus coffea]
MSVLLMINKFWLEYAKTTPKKVKIVDSYLFYVFLTGVNQFIYCCLVGTFPFNSFLSGFISSISCFILAVCLRLQVNPINSVYFDEIGPERGFAEFLFAHVILHLVIMNFIG